MMMIMRRRRRRRAANEGFETRAEATRGLGGAWSAVHPRRGRRRAAAGPAAGWPTESARAALPARVGAALIGSRRQSGSWSGSPAPTARSTPPFGAVAEGFLYRRNNLHILRGALVRGFESLRTFELKIAIHGN